MPVDRFRFIRPVPRTLEFGSVRYVFEIMRQKHETIPLDEWVFRARKVGTEHVRVIASAMVRRSWLEDLLTDGFDVETGTPAAKIMERFVREGVAEKARHSRR